MTTTVCDQMLEGHRLASRGRAGRGAGVARLALRVDQVAIEGEVAALVMRMFETLGRPRCGPDLLLGAGESRPGDDLGLRGAAQRHHAVFSRAGNGAIHRVHAARFAAPGRVVVGSDERILASGAFGMLALVANPVEIATALAGEPIERPWPEVAAVRFFGRAPDWLAGDDLALAVGRRLEGRLSAELLEFHVIEPGGLGFAARAPLTRQVGRWGGISGLFPSDDATRGELLRQQREVDWKPQSADPGTARAILDLDFSDLEPLVGGVDGESVVALRECAGQAVDAVWAGPELPLEDLGRLVARLETQPLHPGVALLISLGDRQAHATAAASGWIGVLKRAGARFVVEEQGRFPAVPAGNGLCIACGVPRLATHPGRWRSSGPEACVAAALGGALADPRSLPPHSATGGARIVVDDRLLDRPAPETAAASDAAPANGIPIAPPITGGLRGTVLIKLGDRAGANHILPWGARVRPLGLQIDDLKKFAFAGVDRGFAARAAAHGGGWVVAGRDLGAGPRREQIGLVAVRLGLRAILALGFAAEFRRMLLQHGVLALRFLAPGDYDDVCAGDELEIPDLPEALETGKPLVVRNLTRGGQYALHHDLGSDEIDEVRAGGRLAAARRSTQPARRERQESEAALKADRNSATLASEAFPC